VDGERGAELSAPSQPATPMALDRVLIIDDNEIERYALRQFLSTSRYEVIEATGGYEGLRLARQAQPDVIFLDLMMPDVHGFEVLKMLKAIEDTRRIPVVLFTSQRLENEGDRERAAAADALLLKSDLSRDSVIDTMHRVCGVTETDHVRNA
jgi:CheY-like chemotaxis protein